MSGTTSGANAGCRSTSIPSTSQLDDELERERLRRVFSQGSAPSVGYALPLERLPRIEGTRWRTGPWFLRDERLFLMPGDSPMGYRLPLDSLPWAAAVDRPSVEPLRSDRARGRRSPPHAIACAGVHVTRAADRPADDPRRRPTAPDARRVGALDTCAPRSALEARDGVLYVFMPPIVDGRRVSRARGGDRSHRRRLGMPVLLEGYPPPYDPRLRIVLDHA